MPESRTGPTSRERTAPGAPPRDPNAPRPDPRTDPVTGEPIEEEPAEEPAEVNSYDVPGAPKGEDLVAPEDTPGVRPNVVPAGTNPGNPDDPKVAEYGPDAEPRPEPPSPGNAPSVAPARSAEHGQPPATPPKK